MAFLAPALGILFFFAARADAAVTVAGVTVHSAEEVRSRFILHTDHGLVFRCPEGEWELIETVSGLASNRGDGSFHSMNTTDVEDALRGLEFPLDGQNFDVYILPLPRKSELGSSSSGRAVFLSPGVLEYSAREIHFVTSHEAGHLVQSAWMPDGNEVLWARYRELRQISNTEVYCAGATHPNRPHEIFAEDFRFLFGDKEARYTGGIENTGLERPDNRPAIRQFFLALRADRARASARMAALASQPNPFVSSTVLTFTIGMASGSDAAAASALLEGAAGVPVTLEVFSSDGRLVRKLLERQQLAGEFQVRFDGRDGGGHPLQAGVYFARLRAGNSITSRKLVLAR